MPRSSNSTVSDGREFSPFWEAFNTAKRIVTRKPAEEQPKEAESLEAAVGMLTDQERSAVVFRAVVPALSEEFPVQGLFALARAARMSHVAHATAAILSAKKAEGLTVPELQPYGLVELRVSEAKNVPYFLPKIGKEAVREAAKRMATDGRNDGAKTLRIYLERSAQAAELSKARREASKTASVETPSVETKTRKAKADAVEVVEPEPEVKA